MAHRNTLNAGLLLTALVLTIAGCPGTLEDKQRFEQGATSTASASSADASATTTGIGGNGGAALTGNGGTGG